MGINEFKDRLFDVLNDTDDLPIQDIVVGEAEDKINVYLEDGTMFVIRCESAGIWWLMDGQTYEGR